MQQIMRCGHDFPNDKGVNGKSGQKLEFDGATNSEKCVLISWEKKTPKKTHAIPSCIHILSSLTFLEDC